MRTRLALPLALLSAAALAHPEEGLVTMGTLPQGEVAITASAGQPFLLARIDYGLLPWLDAGVQLSGTVGKLVRPGLGARARLFRRGCGGFTARADLSLVRPLGSAYGPRPLARTGNAELGIQADLAFGATCALGVSLEVSGLLDTDLSSARTGFFVQTLGGLEYAPLAQLSVLAKAGELRGLHGAGRVFSLGTAIRF